MIILSCHNIATRDGYLGNPLVTMITTCYHGSRPRFHAMTSKDNHDAYPILLKVLFAALEKTPCGMGNWVKLSAHLLCKM